MWHDGFDFVRARVAGVLLLMAGCIGCAPRVCEPAVEARLRALTGGHTRLVWVQDLGDGTDIGLETDNLRLMGFDSDDGLGARPILDAPDNYTRPLITPRGDRVIFTNRRRGKIFIVHWDGGGLRPIVKDRLALSVWADAAGREWLYAGPAEGMQRQVAFVERYLVDNPAVVEMVWDRTPVGLNNFQLSADGRRAGGVFPWPESGVADLAGGHLRIYGRGCYPALAPDDSGLFWIFDGAHRNLLFFDRDMHDRWRVNINAAPGIDGYEVYYPRWSNRARFMVMTGPFKEGTGENRIRGGGAEVEVYVGRFSDDFRAVEAWCRVTYNELADFYPDVWIAPDAARAPEGPRTAAPDAARAPAALPDWPVDRSGLVMLWEHRARPNEIADPLSADAFFTCRLEPRGMARYGRNFEMRTARGFFEAQPETVRRVAAALRRSGRIGLALTVVPDAAGARAPGVILGLGAGGDDWRMLLGERDARLVLLARRKDDAPGAELDLGPLPPGESARVMLEIYAGGVTCQINGQRSHDARLEDLDPGDWSLERIVFGDAPAGGWNWTGMQEGLAVFDRHVDAQEARRDFEAYAPRMKGRRRPEYTVVDARLVLAADIPDPQDILPYRRALAADRYRVERVVEGAVEASEIMAARWVIMDGAVLEGSQRFPDRMYRLRMELYDDRPELEGERLTMPGDAWDVPVYYIADE